MTAKRPFAKIAITLPAADLEAADRLAVLQDRSRSWIIAESVRRYVAACEAAEPASALGASRHEQLRRDLELTAHQRVHDAERGAAAGAAAAASLEQPRRFGSFDDFLTWRRATVVE
jgi:predicted transcriptional regulator